MPKSAVYFELIGLVNLTTDVSIIKSIGQTRIEALEYDTDRMMFECLERSCNTGQLVRAEGFICYPKSRVEFSCVGKITDVRENGEGTLKVTIHFLQYNKEIWTSFLKEMKSRQNGVDQLFEALKEEE
ncbi:MAG: hypothetical protein JNM39_04785 [Bdellovibrionaceae bacterium]|nr:hypothetical protein [Pseudobdellovibrionaceae bacterium]